MDTKILEISLIVEEELVEPVAELLAEHVKGGVAIESTAVTSTMDGSAGRAIGPLKVYGYLTIDEFLEEKRQRLEEGLWYLSRIRPLPEPSFRVVLESDWAEAWKKHYHPIPIGKQLVIVPAWLESPAPDRIPIRIDPGMAFGTGTHPTTQLCMELIEDILSPLPVENPVVIDIGCGTAILSIAALKLGAVHALGVDIDPDAVRASRENAAANQVGERLEVGPGSLAEIQAGSFSIDRADVVLANILAPVCISLLEAGMADLLKPGGQLVLSGILDEQAPQVVQAAERSGLSLLETRQINDWVALRFTAPL